MDKTNKENKEEYNGWTNRETWALNLHLTNDEWLYNEVRSLLKQKYEFKHQKDDALRTFVEDLKYNLYEGEYEGETLKLFINMFDDIGSLWRVNYTEIVKTFLEE